MTDSANNSNKEKLELEQLHLNNEKLKVELNKLRQDTRPDARWFRLLKNVGALGAAATVVATLYGIYDSYNKTIEDRRQSRISEQRSQISEAINKLQSPNTISKLIGVSILSGYLGSNDQTQKSSGVVTALLDVFGLNANLAATGSDVRRQILFSLVSLVATEKDLQTQAAVADLIDSIPKDGPIGPDDWEFFQKLLVTESRALMAKGDLLSLRQFRGASQLSDEEIAAQAVGKLIMAYLNHIVRSLDSDPYVYVIMPKFSCANLEDANFDNQVLFPGIITVKRTYKNKKGKPTPNWYQNLSKVQKDKAQKEGELVFSPLVVVPPIFFKSNLKGTHLEETKFFAVVPKVIPPGSISENYFISSLADRQDVLQFDVAEFTLWEGVELDEAFRPRKDDINDPVSRFQDDLAKAFASVDIDKALLRASVADFLKKSRMRLDGAARLLNQDDPDSQCVPRLD